MKRKLVSILACRNNGSRLYAKPLQNLNEKTKILEYILLIASKSSAISETVLAISNKKDNCVYKEIAKKNKIKYYFGSDYDVLGRLVMGIKKTEATDIFRVTSESPFIYHEYISKIWKIHKENNYDLSIFSNNVDGMGFEIFKADALKKSHKYGKKKHKSELCDLYIRENVKKFNVKYYTTGIKSKNYRLTVDNPEDLILCRKIFNKFYKKGKLIPTMKILSFIKKNKFEVNLTKKFISKSKSINNLWKNAETI